MKKEALLSTRLNFFAGSLLGIFWILDAYVKFYVMHVPYRLFWYCSLGLLITSIALIFKNRFLLTAMLCSLILVEGLWYISFLLSFLHADFLGMATYRINPADYKVVNAYHIFLLPTLLFALFTLKRPHPRGWLGALIFVLFAGLGALIFTKGADNVNCVFNDATCSKFFSFFYTISNPFRIFLGASSVTLFFFLPFNKLLVRAKNYRGR